MSIRTGEVSDFIKQNGGVWGAHPDFPKEDWIHLVVENCTILGYWEWVMLQVEAEDTKG